LANFFNVSSFDLSSSAESVTPIVFGMKLGIGLALNCLISDSCGVLCLDSYDAVWFNTRVLGVKPDETRRKSKPDAPEGILRLRFP
jgi:hypothetical protein